MNCSKCGKELTENSSFCSNCGAQTIQTKIEEKNYSQLLELYEQDNTTFLNIPNFWNLGLKLISYLGIVIAIILGVYLWVQFANYGQGGFGFILFLICLVIIFLFVAFTMVFLDLSKDMKKTRKYLANKK